MRLDASSRTISSEENNLSLRSSFSLGFKELYKPTLSYRLGLLWLILDPFLTTAIYGFLIIVVRGNFNGWSVLLGVLTLLSLNRSVSTNVSARLSAEPFPLMHTQTTPILLSKYITSASQSFLVGLTGAFAIFLLSGAPISLFIYLPLVCVMLSFFGVSIGLLISPITTLLKDVEKVVSYLLLIGFFLQAVLYEFKVTSGLHREVLSVLPHTLGVEWLRSVVGGGQYPFPPSHLIQVLTFWLIVCIFSISRINRARWRLTTWD